MTHFSRGALYKFIFLAGLSGVLPLSYISPLRLFNTGTSTTIGIYTTLKAQTHLNIKKPITTKQYINLYLQKHDSLLAEQQQQLANPLHYFQDSNGKQLYGVRDSHGKIIIPAKFRKPRGVNLRRPIGGGIIEMPIRDSLRNKNSNLPATPFSEVYNRKGQLLYLTQFFDNGSDYFSEGLRRYVDHQKIGFVNRQGNIIIPAYWDFATPFQYGYATVYIGGWEKKVIDKMDQHWIIQPTSDTATHYVINKKGERVSPLTSTTNHKIKQTTSSKTHSSQDIHTKTEVATINGKRYPYPFKYNKKEQQIRNRLNQHKALINFIAKELNTHKSSIHFEVVENPSSYFPFYSLQLFDKSTNNDYMTIYADTDGQAFYYYQPFDEVLTPLNLWLQEQHQ